MVRPIVSSIRTPRSHSQWNPPCRRRLSVGVTAFAFLLTGLTFSEIAAALQIADPGPEAATAPAPVTPAQVTFAPMPPENVQTLMLQWMAGAGTDRDTAAAVTALWADTEKIGSSSAEELLDRVIESFATADPETRRFVDLLRSQESVELPAAEGIRDDSFYQNSVQLFYARMLTQHRLFDEALAVLDALNPDTSIDPASVFFYRAVCQQRLLQRDAALQTLTLLQHNTVGVPDRFRAVAAMMMQELRDQQSAGLEEVARVMSDVQRRLDLGRSGEKVQKQEDQVIALLDKLLEDMQQQSQQQQGSGGGSGGGSENQPSGQGADDSRVKGAPGEGIADRRELTESGSWGMLNPQAEARARELIRQQFPANYLDAISQYTRKIAERRK